MGGQLVAAQDRRGHLQVVQSPVGAGADHHLVDPRPFHLAHRHRNVAEQLKAALADMRTPHYEHDWKD